MLKKKTNFRIFGGMSSPKKSLTTTVILLLYMPDDFYIPILFSDSSCNHHLFGAKIKICHIITYTLSIYCFISLFKNLPSR